jgi:hypothetical protein
MTEEATQQPAEFSRPIAVEQIGPQETVREIAANVAERARLAERFGLLGLDRLVATVRLRRGRAGLVLLEGHFEADAVQACVVTLEPVPANLAVDFAVTFGAAAPTQGGTVVVGFDQEDPPEEIVNGRIDLGETVAQQLAVALDPYPRSAAAAASTEGALGDASAGPKPAGPFAALNAWRRPQGN